MRHAAILELKSLLTKRADGAELSLSYQFPIITKAKQQDAQGRDEWIIRGLCSTPEVDRKGDVILASAWKDAFPEYIARGGVILFNHNSDRPVGVATGGKLTDGGPELEAKIVDPEIGRLLDLGVLNSYSIGIVSPDLDDVDVVELGDSYQLIIKRVKDLAEVSIVSVPANRGAQFTVQKECRQELITKSLETNPRETVRKTGGAMLEILIKMLGLVAGAGEGQIVFAIENLKRQATMGQKVGDLVKALNLDADADVDAIRKAIADARNPAGFVSKADYDKLQKQVVDTRKTQRLEKWSARITDEIRPLAEDLAEAEDETRFLSLMKSLNAPPEGRLTPDQRHTGAGDSTRNAGDAATLTPLDLKWMGTLGYFRDERDASGHVTKAADQMAGMITAKSSDVYGWMFGQPVETDLDRRLAESRGDQ